MPVECIHLLTADTCAVCRRTVPPRRTLFVAEHETDCDGCDGRIFPGDELIRVDGKWVHAEHGE